MRNEESLSELVQAVELAEVVQAREIRESESEGLPEGCRVTDVCRRSLLGRADTPGPHDEPMPTDPNPLEARAWLTGCIMHRAIPTGAPERRVWIDRRLVKALLDSGSS